MDTIKITTPENIEVEYRLAGLGSRAAASLVDMLIQFAVIGGIALVLALSGFTSSEFYQEYEGWIIGITLILIFVITYGYFIVFELTMNGKTPGKKIFHLRTIRNNGQPITAKHSVIRNLFRTIIDLYGVGVIMMFVTKQHKRIGDFLASTIVIAEDQKEIPAIIELDYDRGTSYKYSITQQEYELLKEYFNRKDSISEDAIKIKNSLAEYFISKLDIEVDESDYDRLLNDLINSRG